MFMRRVFSCCKKRLKYNRCRLCVTRTKGGGKAQRMVENTMKRTYRFDKCLYSKEALLKAAYQYIDDFYLHLDVNEKYYTVEIEGKIAGNHLDYDEFQNEVLLQETRKMVADKTKNIREVIFARAMASTIVSEEKMPELMESGNAEEILVNWFDGYGK